MGTICATQPHNGIKRSISYNINMEASRIHRTNTLTTSNEAFRNIKSADPKMSQFLFIKAKKYLLKGNFLKAKWKLKESLSADPKNQLALYTVAKLYFENGDMATSTAYVDKCLDIDKNDVMCLNLKTQISIQRSSYNKALDTIDRAYKLKRDYEATLLLYAYLMEFLDFNKKAINLYIELLNHTNYSDLAFIYCKIAYNYTKLRNIKQTQKYMDMAHKKDTLHPLLCFVHIFTYFAQGDYKSCMMKCEEYNTRYFKIAAVNHSEVLFIWTLAYKYVSQLKFQDQKPYKVQSNKSRDKKATSMIKLADSEYINKYKDINLTRRHRKTIQSLQEYEELARQLDDHDTEKGIYDIIKMKLYNIYSFDKDFFDVCLFTASKENPYKYAIVIYCLEYFIDECPNYAVKLLEVHKLSILFDLKMRKAGRSFMIKLLNILDNNWHLKYDISTITLDLYESFKEAEVHFIEAAIYIEKLEPAEEHIMSLQNFDDTEADVLFFRYLLHHKQYGGFNRQILTHLFNYIKLNPSNNNSFYRLIEYHGKQNDNEMIITLYKIYLEYLDDKNVHFKYALFLRDKGMLVEAKEEFMTIYDKYGDFNQILRLIKKIEFILTN